MSSETTDICFVCEKPIISGDVWAWGRGPGAKLMHPLCISGGGGGEPHYLRTIPTAVLNTTTPSTPAEVIQWIAQVAASFGRHAGVGAMETAGTIVSVLAANPHIIDRFLKDGAGTFIDGPIDLDVVNGCLTYYAQTGELLSPAELHRRRGGVLQ